MGDLDQGRRYGTIEDFRNFVKLTYMSPALHHSGAGGAGGAGPNGQAAGEAG